MGMDLANEVSREQCQQLATDTLYHMARQLLSALDKPTRERVEAIVTDLSIVVADYLSISFTDKELMVVTAKLYAFLVEAGVIS